MNTEYNPLTSPPPAEVPLPQAPLVRVIAQVRFPPVLSIKKPDFVAPFQEAIRRQYPNLRPQQTREVIVGPAGVEPKEPSSIWRFSDGKDVWRVSLAADFIALETTSYTSRSGFLERFGGVLKALASHVDPGQCDRLGVRYIDRVTGLTFQELCSLVRPEVAGVLATSVSGHARHSLCESLFDIPDGSGQLLTRWGWIPAHGTVDPAAIEPLSDPSWILDVDIFRRHPQAFEVDAVLSQTSAFAERAYAFFRWAVTDEFLRRFGGKI